MKPLKDIYEKYAEPGLPFEIFKSRLYDFLLDLDAAGAFNDGVYWPDDIMDNPEKEE